MNYKVLSQYGEPILPHHMHSQTTVDRLQAVS